MPTLKEQVPKSVRTPVSLLSFVVGIFSAVVGWILVTLGLTLYWDLHGIEPITGTDSLIILGIGLAVATLSYFGLKGFMYFSY